MMINESSCKSNQRECREFTSDLIWESSDEPNKIKKIENAAISSLNPLLDIV